MVSEGLPTRDNWLNPLNLSCIRISQRNCYNQDLSRDPMQERRKQMLTRRFIIHVMISAVLAVSIVAIERSSWAKGKNDPAQVKKECSAFYAACTRKCDQNYHDNVDRAGACFERCADKQKICLDIEIDRSTGTTGTSTKGKDPVTTGGVKDPGGGSSSPTKPIRTSR